MILVTGGTGLVGSHLLFQLVQNHSRIRAVRRAGSDLEHVRHIFSYYSADSDVLFEKIEWVEADIEDMESLYPVLNAIHHVYHCAASVSFDPADKKSMIRNNVLGTANLVNACLECHTGKFCFVSSTSALGGSSEDKEITEDMIRNSARYKSAYAVSKFKSEMEVWRGIAEGLKAVIVNPSIIIGPGNWKRSSSRFFPAVWKGMRFYTEGVTGYVDVRDVVTAMIKLMESDFHGERYILSSQNLSYRELLEMIAACLGRRPPSVRAGSLSIALAWRLDWLVHKITGKPRSITREAVMSSLNKSYFSNQKIKKATGMEFRSVSDSIRDTARLFLSEQ